MKAIINNTQAARLSGIWTCGVQTQRKDPWLYFRSSRKTEWSRARAVSLAGRAGARKAENHGGGHSRRGSSSETEVREDWGSLQLQAMWWAWKICCMGRVLTDEAGKISSIQSGCVYSVHHPPWRLAQSLSGSKGSINVSSLGMKDSQGLDQEVNQILIF